MPITRTHMTRSCRWAVLCLLLSWCVAFASPLFKPASLQLICGHAGLELVVLSDAQDDEGALQASGLDCPACLPVGLPPADPGSQPRAALPAAAIAARFISHPPSFTGLAPPARGPPQFFPDRT